MTVKAYGLTDIGLVREENQDAFFIDESLGLFMVADGMGGMDDGAAASLFTIRGMYSLIQSFSEKHGEDIGDVEYKQYLKKSIIDINRHLREAVGKNTGSTLVLLQIFNDNALFVNVGDSPGYLYRGGKLQQMTRYHNVAGAMAEMNMITPAEAKTHPAHNRLTAYMGMNGTIQASFKRAKIQPGDRILLCSDGLTGMVDVEAVTEVLKTKSDIEVTAKTLVDMALKAGGIDNVTVVLADISE
jgi:PPM family protein phosphatase